MHREAARVRDVVIVASAFLASAVEMVEALTIVLAVGITRGWRATLLGVASALGALVATVAVLGPALRIIPIDTLRLVVGFLLLVFGLQWLSKAILRASGYKAMHDEEQAYREEVREATEHERSGGAVDWFAFTLAFKGVFLEGLEVIFIVLTIGASQGNQALAALGAGAAVVVVATAGIVVRAPLSRVPENAMKFAVGSLLTSFGIFWATEGAGAAWPGGDLALPLVLGFVLIVSVGLVAHLRGLRSRTEPPIEDGSIPFAETGRADP
jgi:uncharacterized membrane protein